MSYAADRERAAAELRAVEFKMRRVGDAAALRDMRQGLEVQRRALAHLRQRLQTARASHDDDAIAARRALDASAGCIAATRGTWAADASQLDDRLRALRMRSDQLSLLSAEVEWLRQEKARLGFRLRHLQADRRRVRRERRLAAYTTQRRGRRRAMSPEPPARPLPDAAPQSPCARDALRKYVRRGAVPAEDRAFLGALAGDVLAQGADQPCHVMVYGHGAPPAHDTPLLPRDRREQLVAIAERLVRRFAEGGLLLSVRLLVAPPGAPPQQWHLDYRSHKGLGAQTVFAALTPATEANCTEMLLPNDTAVAAELERRVRAVEAGEAAGPLAIDLPAAAVTRHPLLLDTFDVACVATSQLPHRRGPTAATSTPPPLPLRAHTTRITLNVDFTECSPAQLKRIGFLDDDSVTASASGGVVGRSVVDDLHSEVVVNLLA